MNADKNYRDTPEFKALKKRFFKVYKKAITNDEVAKASNGIISPQMYRENKESLNELASIIEGLLKL